MAKISLIDKKLIEEVLQMGSGYVLDFTDTTFFQFFKEFSVNIQSEKYYEYGTSKAKRLRAFLEKENEVLVAEVLEELFTLAIRIQKLDGERQEHLKGIISKMKREKISVTEFNQILFEEEKFIAKEINQLDLSFITDPNLKKIINERLLEIGKSLKNGMYLSTNFLCGSTLEGLLLEIASIHPQKFNVAESAPKDRTGKVLPLIQWSLNSLIDVSYETKFIDLDTKKFAAAIRDFRNFIHPRQQITMGFSPAKRTAEINLKVVQSAIEQINSKMKGKVM